MTTKIRAKWWSGPVGLSDSAKAEVWPRKAQSAGSSAPPTSGDNPQSDFGSKTAPFRLSRWFAGLALMTIGAIAIACALLLSWFVTQRMLRQEAALTRDFVQALVATDEPMQGFFLEQTDTTLAAAKETFLHFSSIPDTLRLNVYDTRRKMLWSTNASMIGQQFGPNHELDEALAGHVVVEAKTNAERRQGKAEYVALTQPSELFVEIYVPIRDSTGHVLGAVEFYKNPRGLMRSLHELRLYIAGGALVFGLLLFAVLSGLIRRADNHIQAQERKLVDAETFAAIGEMSSVVAHGIRNPLASIRSSAELILLDRGDESLSLKNSREAARDIVAQSDRLGDWLRELLSWMRPSEERTQPMALAPLAESCLVDFYRETERRRIRARSQIDASLPAVQGDPVALGQVLRSLVANAIDAVADGGVITLSAQRINDGRSVRLEVHDNGPGIRENHRNRVGKPFFTTKPHGMGVGLSLARRLIERQGGQFNLDGSAGTGTTATIELPVATTSAVREPSHAGA